MSVSVSYNPTPSTPLGFTARVAPAWGGESMSGAEALWGRETMAAGLQPRGSLGLVPERGRRGGVINDNYFGRSAESALPHLICYRATIVASQFLLPKEATMSTISPGTRQELVTAVADRYRQSTAAEKRLILDEFVALTGYHRKHAVRVLNGSAITPRARRGRRCVYDAAVTEGLIVLWEASDRMCGKRLKALLPTLVPALEHHGHLSLDPAVRERLLAVSAATIDRRRGP